MEQRLRERRPTDTPDPCVWMDGFIGSPEIDLASRVDEMLYQ